MHFKPTITKPRMELVKNTHPILTKLFLAAALLTASGQILLTAQSAPLHWKFAPTPPLGWNSWDCFGTTITESQAKAQADAMARELNRC